MSRLKNVVALVFVVQALLSLHAAGQPANSGRVTVSVEVAATPTAQFQRCDAMLARAYNEPDEQKRFQQVLAVLANLDVVRRAWPNDTVAITDAAIMQADVALEFNMPRNAIDALGTIPEGESSVAVERRLGRAYDALHDDAAAERYLLAAEKLIQKRREYQLNDADETLYALGKLYDRMGKPREAIRRFRAAAILDGQKPARAAVLTLAALKAAVRDESSRSDARAIATDVEKHIQKARTGEAGKVAGDTLAAIERDLARLRTEFGL